MPEFNAMTVAEADRICTVTLNRPDVLNRIDEAAHRDFITLFRWLEERTDVGCVVLASTGKHFSAGGDLNEIFNIQADHRVLEMFMQQARALFYGLIDVRVPIVVALHGDAHGLGANIVLACDVIVACKKARLGDTHVAMGMVAGDGGCVAWPQSMGLNWAKRHLLTGDMLPAEAAYARGLVTDLVETPEEALPAAQKIAARIAALPPLAVRGTKRALNHVMRQRADEVFDLALALEQTSLTSQDVREAVTAFMEKRAPVYKGQ